MPLPLLDDIDKAMLQSITAKPGQSIRDIIRPYLKEKSETALRMRLRALMLHDYIEFDPGMGKVQVFPTSKTKNHPGRINSVHRC